MIPFKYLPASWGLKGQAFDIAEAYYLYQGEDLDRRLAEIKFKKGSPEYRKQMLIIDRMAGLIDDYNFEIATMNVDGFTVQKKAAIDLKFGKITPYEFDRLSTEEIEDDFDRNMALLAVDLKHGKITQNAYDKKIATMNEKPWIGIINQGFDEEYGVNGVFFEFDWNNYWIDYLRLNGYTGLSEEEIVERWFQDVCKVTFDSSLPIDQDEVSFPVAGRMTTNRHKTSKNTFYS